MKDVLKTDEFVREPVDEICMHMQNDPAKKIILTGDKGSGKSTVLKSKENIGLGNQIQSIYTKFNDNIINCNKFDNIFDEDFIIHFYEVILSQKIINYIKTNYKYIYQKYFNTYEEMLEILIKEIDNYVRNIQYKKIKIKNYMKTGQISKLLIEKLKNCLNISLLTLEIDKFDSLGNEICQNILSQYFDIFDKTIITIENELLPKKKKDLIEKGYSIFDIDYNKDKKIIKEIILRKVDTFNNKNTDIKFPIEFINNELCKYLIRETEGNITSILSIIREVYDDLMCNKDNFEISNSLINCTKNEKIYVKTMKGLCKSSQFYL